MFRGNQAIAYDTTSANYNLKSADAQLQSVKEMGMVFEYLNDAKVWPKFCATFEAIYDLLGEFDTYHISLASLQPE